MSLYIFDAYTLDTTPGDENSPFSPPEWLDGSDEYLFWLREQFKVSPLIRQRLAVAARGHAKGVVLIIDGPYEQTLAHAIAHFGKHRQQPA